MPTIQQQIEALRAQGRAVCVAPPPTCLALWERARADGRFRLGQLFVVNQPLDDHSGGALEIPSGDIWVLHAEDCPEETTQTLLHELSHASRWREERPTLAAYWDEEEAAIRDAHSLAQEWGVSDLFPLYLLRQALRVVEQRRIAERLAADVAGSSWHAHAKAAYRVLEQIGLQHLWDVDTFWLALRGHSADERHDAVVDFDRTCLREVWRPTEVGGSFGREALSQGTESARLLRAALRSLARQDGPDQWHYLEAGPARPCSVHRLHQARGLTPVLRAAQAVLLAYEDSPAQATWSLSTDPQPDAERLYHLSLSYGEEDPPAHLWVRASRAGATEHQAEAAWQRYITSWLTQTSLAPGGSLAHGHQLLQDSRRRKS